MREWQPFARLEQSVNVPSLEKLVPGVMKRMGLEKRLHESQVHQFWAQIVGSDVALHAHPVSLQNGLLEVAVDQPIWHQELRPHKALMLQKIRARIGQNAVRDIRFRIG